MFLTNHIFGVWMKTHFMDPKVRFEDAYNMPVVYIDRWNICIERECFSNLCQLINGKRLRKLFYLSYMSTVNIIKHSKIFKHFAG